jgi:hypothetical protein
MLSETESSKDNKSRTRHTLSVAGSITVYWLLVSTETQALHLISHSSDGDSDLDICFGTMSFLLREV